MDNNNFQNHPTPEVNSLRLLSIHKISKLLGIRFQSAKKLVMAGKINFIRVGKRMKIPYMNLVKFLEGPSADNNIGNADHSSTDGVSKRIDELIAAYRST